MRVTLADAGASVADLGTLLPITAALVVTNGVDPVAAFALAGVLFVVAGLVYRVPVPVQPIKAAAAIAIATHASPPVIAAAGLVLGIVLLLIAVFHAAPLLVRIFPKPLIRGNQLGVGVLLVIAAVTLVRKASESDMRALLVTAALVAVLAVTERQRRVPVALLMVAGGIGWSVLHGASAQVAPHLALPAFALPGWRAAVTALTLLVIPQLPLTLGNAIVGTADLETDYYGARASRVTARNLCVSCGVANVAVGVLGGMPLCHGSSGATAYYRFGARTGGVNLVAGVTLIVAGVAFGRAALDMFGLIPGPVLGALLAYTGARHALLVKDLRGWRLAVALGMGVAGGLTRNLTIGMAIGLPAYAAMTGGLRLRARRAT